jgi:hypothetical protein
LTRHNGLETYFNRRCDIPDQRNHSTFAYNLNGKIYGRRNARALQRDIRTATRSEVSNYGYGIAAARVERTGCAQTARKFKTRVIYIENIDPAGAR